MTAQQAAINAPAREPHMLGDVFDSTAKTLVFDLALKREAKAPPIKSSTRLSAVRGTWLDEQFADTFRPPSQG